MTDDPKRLTPNDLGPATDPQTNDTGPRPDLDSRATKPPHHDYISKLCPICKDTRNSWRHKRHMTLSPARILGDKRARHMPVRVATHLEILLSKNCKICGTNTKAPHYCNRILNSLKSCGLVPPKFLDQVARFELQRRLDLHHNKQVPMDVIAINTTQIHAFVLKLTTMGESK